MTRRLLYPLVAVCLVAFVGASEESCSTEEEKPTVERGDGGSEGGDVETARVGDRMTLKGTTYRVRSVKTAGVVGDNEFNRVEANGQFVIVRLTLTNRKDEPATILEDNIRLIGGNGKNYSTSDDALLAFGDQTLLLEEIQPDNTERGTLVYDVPKRAVSGAKLRVTDLFSESKGEIDLGL